MQSRVWTLVVLNVLLGSGHQNSVENSNLKKTEFFNISVFLGIPGPGRNQQEIYHLVVSQCHNDASPSFTCQVLFTQIESHKTALARACCTSSFNLFTRVKPLVTFIHGEFDMSARPNWRALHGSLL